MPVLVDSNVILDIFTQDSRWYDWSAEALARCAGTDTLCINATVYAEVSVRFESIEELEEALPHTYFRREHLPYEAAFLAGKCFMKYRKQGGQRRAPLPDFYIGAHAAIRQWRLLTRDAARYASYFPTVELICPSMSTSLPG